MSKGIVVVEIPDKCCDCMFSNPDGDWCPFHGEVSYSEYGSRKPDNCPIKELPDYIHSGNTAYQNGHNELLVKILN